ncbi:MAG: hypothetical protein JWO91_537 [Acidobacteriaceae bacterium]|jgi:hypothetical protein|nr:hypothetical protein [Acidobacteriaceae bacterium]
MNNVRMCFRLLCVFADGELRPAEVNCVTTEWAE